MSSESSEDENIELLREAANNEFANYSLNSANGKEQNSNSGSVQKRSLRPQAEAKINDMNVAPEVQKFLAKRLTDFIDSQLEEVEGSARLSCQKRKIGGGIHLLSSSEHYLRSVPRNVDVKLKRYCHKSYPKKIDCELSLEEKCREAAVSPDWILSQEATYGWEPNTRGKVEIYSANEVEIKIESAVSGKSKDNPKNTSQLSLEEKQEKKRLKRQRSRAKLKLIKYSEKKKGDNSNKKVVC